MMKKLLGFAVLSTALSFGVFAESLPGKGVKVKPARATWNTGFFQGVIIQSGLEELGYKLRKPQTLDNPVFYLNVSTGGVDYWANGNFPIHEPQLPKKFYERAEKVGMLVEKGGVQGYLVSKKHADELNIQSIEDFKREDVKKVFDLNDDGKVDLVGCPQGWGCAIAIEQHLADYELADHVNVKNTEYAIDMAEAISNYKSGKAVAFYTWTPNWTVFELKPGEDVVWINVPPKEDSADIAPLKVEGGVSEEIYTGFPLYDIQVVANKKFLENNPAARSFFESVKIPVEDINAQNALLHKGENKNRDIEKHAEKWIADNKELWDSWIAKAKSTN